MSLVLDGGVEIFSANEVCRFLCGETGNEGFYGEDPAHQALVDYWLGWEASELKVRTFNNQMALHEYDFESAYISIFNLTVDTHLFIVYT